MDDISVISRLTAFGEDAQRLVDKLVPTNVLKIRNFKWQLIERNFKGHCTSEVEFRAMRDTTVDFGESLSIVPAEVEAPPPTEIPSDLPLYVPYLHSFVFIAGRLSPMYWIAT